MSDNSIYICGCVKNCNTYLPAIFNNIDKIIPLFSEYKILIAYDNSNDGSYETLLQLKSKYNMEILVNNNCTQYRTQNISNARNSIIKYIQCNIPYDFFIMMDMDDACYSPININVLEKHLKTNDWDSLSFNRPGYYDIWALSIHDYVYSCWHFSLDTGPIKYRNRAAVLKYKKYIIDILSSLNEDQLLDCYSAFNGFAIYRTNMFINCEYKWLVYDNLEFITPEMLKQNMNVLNMSLITSGDLEDCEHRYFHFQAKKLNNARIKISPLCLFSDYMNK